MNLALDRFAPAPVLSIDKGTFLRLPKHTKKTATVTCLSGCLWITHDWQPTDSVISTGESYTSARADRMLIFALQPSSALVS